MVTMKPSFYVTGGTVPRDAPSYVARKADMNLLEGLRAGTYCYVLTSRQMGKSSLMVRTATALREEGVRCVVLDLTGIGQNLTVEQWYDGLLNAAGLQLELEDELEEFWLAHQGQGPLQRWMRALSEVVLPRIEGKIVFFVDEIDAVRSLPFSADEFFAGIRECFNRRTENPEYQRVTFCLLGVATPADLIRDTRTTPFNIGKRIELHDFEPDEAGPLSTGIHKEMAAGEMLLDRILHWTHGHPYLTQRLCRAVQEDPGALMPRDVDRLCEQIFFTVRSQEQDDNLLFVRERLLRSEVELAGLLHIYRDILRGKHVRDDELNPAVDVLRLSGVVRSVRGRLKVRNRIYERVFDLDWVRRNMPDAEVKRQKAAFMRGMVRATTIAFAVVLTMSILAWKAISAGRRAAAGERRAIAGETQARHLLNVANLNLAEHKIGDANAARALELLDEIPASSRGFEWRYLWTLCHQERASFFSGTLVAAYSPDGRVLATVGADGTIVLREPGNGKIIRTLSSAIRIPRTIAFSPDSKTIAAAGGYDSGAERNAKDPQGDVAIWDVSTGRHTHQVRAQAAPITAVVFSPNGKVLATGSSDRVARFWDTVSYKPAGSVECKGDFIFPMAFSPNGDTLAVGTHDGTVYLIETKGMRPRRVFKSGGDILTSISYSPDGRLLATGGDSGPQIWENGSGRQVRALSGHTDRVQSVEFSPDGKSLATASRDMTARLWDVASGKQKRTISGHAYEVGAAHYAPDGKTLATVCGDGTVRLWNLAAAAGTLSFELKDTCVHAVNFTPGGRQIWVSGHQGEAYEIDLLDIAAGRPVRRFGPYQGPFDSVALSPDGRTIGLGSLSRVLCLDTTTGRESLALKGAIGPVAFSLDGKRIASRGPNSTGVADSTTHEVVGTENITKLWDAATGRDLATIGASTGYGCSMAFSPDGSLATTETIADAVELRDSTTGELRKKITIVPDPAQTWMSSQTHGFFTINEQSEGRGTMILPEPYKLAISPDGRMLATALLDHVVTLCDIGTGQILFILRGHSQDIRALAFSPDGRTLATASNDTTVKLWNVATGRETITLRGHKGGVMSVAFSADGTLLASCSADHTVKLWQAKSEAEIAARTVQEQPVGIPVDHRAQHANSSDEEPSGFNYGRILGLVCIVAFLASPIVLVKAKRRGEIKRVWELLAGNFMLAYIATESLSPGSLLHLGGVAIGLFLTLFLACVAASILIQEDAVPSKDSGDRSGRHDRPPTSGALKECPGCGAQLLTTVSICGACGHRFM